VKQTSISEVILEVKAKLDSPWIPCFE